MEERNNFVVGARTSYNIAKAEEPDILPQIRAKEFGRANQYSPFLLFLCLRRALLDTAKTKLQAAAAAKMGILS